MKIGDYPHFRTAFGENGIPVFICFRSRISLKRHKNIYFLWRKSYDTE